MLRGIINFALEKLVHPIFGNSLQLNPLNVVLYSAILAGVAIMLISRIEKSDFSMDKKFFLSSTPLLVLTGFLLGLSNTAQEFLILETPYRFFLIGVVAAVVLAASLELSRRGIAGFHGVLSILPLPGILILTLLTTPGFWNSLILSAVVLTWSSIGYMLLDGFLPELKRLEFVYPVFSHYLDASTSFVALSSGAREKMFLGRFFVELFGPSGIFVLKTLIIVPLTYYIFRRFEGEERLYLLYFITALGMVLSARNFFGLS